MNISPITSVQSGMSALTVCAATRPTFGPVLAEATQAKEAAQKLVASAFVLPLLQELRADPFRGQIGHGGMGEDLFGLQLDTIFADRIVAGSRFSLVEAVYERVTSRPGRMEQLNTHG